MKQIMNNHNGAGRNKGDGIRTAISLSGEQKARLLFYAKDNESVFTTMPCASLALKVANELGFQVSPSSILWARHSVFPETVRKRGHNDRSSSNGIAEIKQRLVTLETTVARLTKELGVANE